jgi:hypothetical protein
MEVDLPSAPASADRIDRNNLTPPLIAPGA